MIKFLAEDAAYKVYSVYESVYLKQKARSRNPDGYEAEDVAITCHYGDPTAALILRDYIIVAGCGLSIFDISTQQETHLFAEPENIKWINGLHWDDMDDVLEFRYVAYDEAGKLRVFRMNALTKAVTRLD